MSHGTNQKNTNASHSKHQRVNKISNIVAVTLLYLYSIESVLGWKQENNPDFPRKKTPDYAEINLLLNVTKQQTHDEFAITHPPPKNDITSPWEKSESTNVEVRMCNTMKMCLEIYSVESLMSMKSQNKLESSIKHILSEGNIDLPFEMDIIDIEVSDHMIQGRRSRRKLEEDGEDSDSSSQLYPLLVCFSIKAEYNYKREIDCEAIILDFLNVYEQSFTTNLLQRLLAMNNNDYFHKTQSIHVVSSLDQSPISSVAYAADQQAFMIQNNEAGNNTSDTAVISFVVAAAIGLILLAFGATLLMQYHKVKQERTEFDDNVYPEEIAVVNVSKVDPRLTWGSEDLEPNDASLHNAKDDSKLKENENKNKLNSRFRHPKSDIFSGTRHPWKKNVISTGSKTTEHQLSVSSYLDSTSPENSSPIATTTTTSTMSTQPHDNNNEIAVATATAKAVMPPKTTFGKLSSSTTKNKNEKIITKKECFAPPGKLGVAIDTLNGIPVVHRVKVGSPLEGILFHLDRIVGIDEVDTTNMSAADVTRVMVSKMNKTRKITYIRNHTPCSPGIGGGIWNK